MRNCSKRELTASRPEMSAFSAVDFCLNQLYRDRSKRLNDLVAKNLSYEELIGALLLARDLAKKAIREERW